MDTVHSQQSAIVGFQSARLPSFIVVLAVLIWLVECYRRVQAIGLWQRLNSLFRQLFPEVMVLTLLSGLVVLRLLSHVEPGLENDEAWRDVNHEWPLLMTADSLLGIQAMLRFVLVLSASFRHSSAVQSPFEGEAATFFLLASLARMLLLGLSPRDVYHLDGPLGGAHYVAFESVAFALLLPFGFRLVKRSCRQMMVLLVVTLGMGLMASRNHFSLAGPEYRHLDMLFSLIMLLEMWAGMSFLYRSSHSGSSQSDEDFNNFAHIILPIQQALPSYFILVAFAPAFHVEQSLVGQGRPFELLQSTGLAQVAMLMLAAYLHFFPANVDKGLNAFSTPIPTSEVPPSDDCVICLGSCEDQCSHKPCWRRLQCGHHFHEDCISQWLKKTQRCPVCRSDLKDKSLSPWKGYKQATRVNTEQSILPGHEETQLEI